MRQYTDDEIIAAYKAHKSLRKAARILGCSFQLVSLRLHQSGYTHRFNTHIRTISGDECAKAWEAVQRGATVDAAACLIGVSHTRLRKEFRARGLSVPLPPVVVTPWSDAEFETLRAHYKRDKSASQIARMLGRSRNEVIGKAHRMGL